MEANAQVANEEPRAKKRKFVVSNTGKRKRTPLPEPTVEDIKPAIVDRELEVSLRCPICYQTTSSHLFVSYFEYKMKAIFRIVPCTHRFCEGCIKKWRMIKNICATCKGSIFGLHRDLFAEEVVAHFYKNNPDAEKSTPRAPWVDPPHAPPSPHAVRRIRLSTIALADFGTQADRGRFEDIFIGVRQATARALALEEPAASPFLRTLEFRPVRLPEIRRESGMSPVRPVIVENSGEGLPIPRANAPEVTVAQAAPQPEELLLAPLPMVPQYVAPPPQRIVHQDAVNHLAAMSAAPIARRPHTRSQGPPQ